MIEAVFSRKGKRLSLLVSGHAQYSAGGEDIVCAAASGIVYALAGYLINECEGAEIGALRSGYASLACGVDGEGAMRMAYIGLLQLAITYPVSVSVRCDAWSVKVGEARELIA